ncbi:MAG: capsule assembly Wzi family protein, partial [Gammaproteobacteria bacterium]
GDSLTVDDEPGNQMAGYDVRLRAPWSALPVAFYAQAIGEDEAGGLPSKFLGLMGIEGWGGSRFGSYRLHAEYADTACSFSRENPEFDCAYRNALYPQGYTHRGRIIGHALDNDGRMYSAGFLLVRPSGETWSMLARRVQLNRAGAAPDLVHTTSASPDELENVEVQYNRAFAWGELHLGAGYDRYDGPARQGSETRGFVRWRQGF